MMTDMTWNEFCELYYPTAKNDAEIYLHKQIGKNGDTNKRVDRNYVIDAAVLAALEKTYTHFDASRGAKITTYLSRVVHNEVVDEFVRESKAAARQDDIDDIKTAVRAYSDDISPEAKDELIARLRIAIAKLSPSDQIILSFWLEDKSSYVARSVEALGTSESYVTLRRFRIFKAIPKLMGMTREDYLLYEAQNQAIILASNIKHNLSSHPIQRIFRPNPIMPTLDIETMAERLAGQVFADLLASNLSEE